MRVVYKYHMRESYCLIRMPEGAQILTFGIQNGMPVLWALVDSDAPPTTRRFVCVGTGWDMDEVIPPDKTPRYIGTATTSGLIWHVFEVTE